MRPSTRSPRQSDPTERSRRVLDDAWDLETALLGFGRGGQGLVVGKARLHDVLPEDVDQRQRVRRRWNVIGRERHDLFGVLEDHRKLFAELLDLVLAQR